MTTIDLFEAMHSQRAIRRYTADPVPPDLVDRVLEAAVRAPSGGNQQPWAFVVVTEPELKRRIAVLYRQAWNEVYGPPERAATLSKQVHSSASYLAEHMADAPVLVLACVSHDGSPSSMGRGASIYPAVQNLMLAAREDWAWAPRSPPSTSGTRGRSRRSWASRTTWRLRRSYPWATLRRQSTSAGAGACRRRR